MTGRILEAFNGILFVLDLHILGVFVAYVWRHIKDTSAMELGLRHAISYALIALSGALSVTVFFFGASLARGVVWRSLDNIGHSPSWPPLSLAMLGFGVLISCIGGFYILWAFSSMRWRKHVLASAVGWSILATLHALFL